MLLLPGEVRRGLKLPLAGLLIGAIGYLRNSSSHILGEARPLLPLIDFVSIFTPFFTWLFALRVFEREPPRFALWGAAGLLAASWVVAFFVLPHTHVGFYIIHIVGLVMIADLFRAAGDFRTPGLSIAGLAAHLGTPEHRLRALINQRLGHRNFSAFLNRYRIAEARAILADRAQVDLPVLNLALDLGYTSLPTFNRAFRAETGLTPTDYRRAMIGQN